MTLGPSPEFWKKESAPQATGTSPRITRHRNLLFGFQWPQITKVLKIAGRKKGKKMKPCY